MAANIFSHFVPPAQGTRSFYEELRNRDVEGDAVDERNLREQFHDYDLENDVGGDDSRITVDSRANLAPGGVRNAGQTRPRGRNRDRWHSQDDEGDNDVPASLLVEPHEAETGPRMGQSSKQMHSSRTAAIPGPSNARARAQWEATRAHQKLHQEGFAGSSGAKTLPAPVVAGIVSGTARDKAAWRWVNVSNLDHFMLDVYNYYEGSGMWCILTDRLLHLVETTFVATFLTFLTQCIDHSKISDSSALKEAIIPQCTRHMSGLWNLGLWMFVFYFIWKIVQFGVDLRRLSHLRDFYVHLLGIPEQDMQTVSWQDVVARIMALRESHAETATNLGPGARKFLGSQSKKRLDAHDIANRLMRKDNFVIAMINKDVLKFSLPIPFLGDRPFFSRTLEWYLNFVVVDFVFDHWGQVNQEFLKAHRRGTLSTKLRQRFVFAGVLNLIFAPFVLAYILILYFFNTFLEFKSDPSKIGARRYTPLAEWKFREFNELPHLFSERLNMSYPFATRYLDQFPKKVTERLARTVAFISGALAAVLTLASLIDPEIFRFEITHERTGLFYIGVLGAVWAFARGRVSEDESVFDPEYAMRNVIEYTHYVPDRWNGRLHSSEVMQEFSELYKLKWVIFLEEVLGIITTPFLLILTLPNCSEQIIDFFREFTIHVDGLGYVCSFAVFDFKKGSGNAGAAANNDVREDYYSTKHGKMAASYYGFLDNYVINPKTGIPGHTPPGVRPHFYPPPAFPPLNSPTLPADMNGSRAGRGDRADRERTKHLGPAGQLQAARTPRFGASVPQPSPMASMLLDPHHHPATVPTMGGRSFHRARQGRAGLGGFGGDASIIEESFEDEGRQGSRTKDRDDDDVYESAGGLGESVWETSPTKALSREGSGAQAGEPEGGVLDLIYQFQQAHRNQRPGGAL